MLFQIQLTTIGNLPPCFAAG